MIRSAVLFAAAAAVLGTGEGDPNTVTVEIRPRRDGYRSPPPHRSSSGSPVKAWRASGLVQPEGGRAAARRRRQIERGQLTAANGLVRESGPA